MAATARALLAQVLAPLAAPASPSRATIESYLRAPETLAKRMVLISVEEVATSPAGLGMRDYSARLVVAVPTTTTGPADDDLDELLDDVLDLLDSNDVPNAVTWTKATRGTYRNSDAPAYLVDVTVTAAISTT